MKKLTSIILILFLSLLSSPSWSETLTIDDLVERNDLYYKKFSNVPFTGKITGSYRGSIKDGKREGTWIHYRDGQVWFKLDYKDGKRNGLLEWYYNNGQLHNKGYLKDGKQDGLWEWYNKDGSLEKTETFKNGEIINCEGDC